MFVTPEADSASSSPLQPLIPGVAAPLCPLPGRDDDASMPDALRGQIVILAFSSGDWNPARAEQMTVLYNSLMQTLSASVALSGGGLRSFAREGDKFSLHLENEEALRLTLREADNQSDAARKYGVYGQQALFVIDEAGIIRWSHVLPQGASPRIEPIIAALRGMSESGAETTAKSGASVAPTEPKPSFKTSRRDFVAAAFAATLALAALPLTSRAGGTPDADVLGAKGAGGAVAPPEASADVIPVRLKVNGQMHTLSLDPRVTLLDALRETMGLTGSKKGCDHGQCGACTVHIDGERALSCLSLTAQQEGRDIVTIEGLAKGDKLHPVQAAFIEYDGYQCGYCTPGQIMSAVALLREGRANSDSEIREGMSGNLCRCAAYPHIVAAVKAVRDSKQRV